MSLNNSLIEGKNLGTNYKILIDNKNIYQNYETVKSKFKWQFIGQTHLSENINEIKEFHLH